MKRDGEWWSGSPLEIREWRRRNHVFEQIAFGRTAAMSLVQDGEPDQITGVQASVNQSRPSVSNRSSGAISSPRMAPRGPRRSRC